MLASDKIRIQCPHCKDDFLQQAKRIRGGVCISCPNCQEAIRFDDASPVDSIRKALSAARKIRRQTSASLRRLSEPMIQAWYTESLWSLAVPPNTAQTE
jgi:hypothetical protein